MPNNASSRTPNEPPKPLMTLREVAKQRATEALNAGGKAFVIVGFVLMFVLMATHTFHIPLQAPLDEEWNWCVLAAAILFTTTFTVWLTKSYASEPVDFACPCCGRSISSHLSWTCGFCKVAHPSAAYAFNGSFLDECKACQSVPKSFVCFHCWQIIFLDTDCNEKNPAYHQLPPEIPPPEENPLEKLAREVEEARGAKQCVDAKIEIMKAKIKLAEAENHHVELTNISQEPLGDEITKNRKVLEARRKVREALMDSKNTYSEETMKRTDISNEQKEQLIDDFTTDVDEMLDSDSRTYRVK